MTKKMLSYTVILICAFFSALNYKIFVFPNSFAPAGIDGICTMIQYLLGTNIGYLSLLVNIPLLIASWFYLDRNFVIKTAIYTIAFSLSSIAIEYMHFIPVYYTETGTSITLAPLSAGAVRGVLYAITLSFSASSGGVDIIAALVKRRKPHLELVNLIFIFNIMVAISSFFVYGFTFEPVICGIIYALITAMVSRSLLASRKSSVRVEIITKDAELLCKDITENLSLSATLIEAKGGYSGKTEKIVLCIVRKESVPSLEKLMHNYPDAVLFESVVTASLLHAR